MSCGIVFLSDNYLDDAIMSLDTGTENAQFPLTNLNNESPAYRFRSNENEVVIIFDLQTTRTIDAIALHGDTNGTLGLTTATVRTSLTLDFSSSVVTNIPLSAEERLGFVFMDEVDHRFVELTLTGTGVYVELSNIFIGEKVEIEQNNLSVSSFRYSLRDNSLISANKYDQMFVDKRNSTKYVSGSLEFCTKSEQETLREIFNRHQRYSPFWMIVDQTGEGLNDGEFILTTYGYLEEVPVWSASGGQHYNANIRINQAG